MASNLDVSAIDVTADMIDETEDVFAPLAAAFSHIHDSAIVYSADGEVVIWNAGAEELFGYTFAEA